MGLVGHSCRVLPSPTFYRNIYLDELIQTFNFDADFVRVVVDDTNNPLFVAKDVATVLGYSDTTNAIKQHCNGVAKHHPIADRICS